ncbi:metallophosphoesterase [Patescibacteria group bacterium]|nr:metallophosphoesterase [Patescibacteria group bacterium]
MGSKHLILPDSHAHPDYPNDRFDWFGKLVLDIKPDVVINIGDLADHASLCAHSNPLEKEGARYKADCEAAYDAQSRIFAPIRKAKRKNPRWVWTLGNHDIRPERYVQQFPHLQGKLRNDDIGYNDFPWEVIPFLEPVDIDGIDYSHYFTSGLMGRPIGGTHSAWSTIKKRNKSSVFGHSHLFDFKVDRTGGRSLLGIASGCFVDYHAGYAGPANDVWHRGVVVISDIEDGIGDVEWISINRLKKAYGSANG